MKILYITSGHKQPYPHQQIDQFIAAALQKTDHEAKIFQWTDRPDRFIRLVETVKDYAPDYIFTIHGLCMSRNLVNLLKAFGSKVGIWFIDDPYDVDDSKQRFFDYDFVFTTEEECVKFYQEKGYRHTYYLPLGTETSFFFPEIPAEEYLSDICLLGSPFSKRVEYVNFLAEHLPDVHFVVVGPFFENQLLTDKIDYRPQHVNPEEIRKYYNGAKINLNIHRNPTENIIAGQNLNTENIPAASPNNRTFDIAACAAFQLVDYRAGLAEVFDLRSEMVIFHSKEEMLAKVFFYLENSRVRTEIATNAYKRVTAMHSMEHRLKEMLRIIDTEIYFERWHLKSPEVLKRGRLVKGSTPGVYFLYNERKHLIPNLETFNLLQFCWEQVQILPDNFIEGLPNGITL